MGSHLRARHLFSMLDAIVFNSRQEYLGFANWKAWSSPRSDAMDSHQPSISLAGTTVGQ